MGGAGTAGTSGTGGAGAGTSGAAGKGGGGTGAGAGGKAGGGGAGAGGKAGGAGAGGSAGDRCDVGVYDPGTPPQSRAITNGENVHDPTMVLSGSTYTVFNTGLWTRTSTNMTSWGSIARVLSPNPSWTASSVPGVTDLWAPDISYFDGRYHLYYAASTFDSNRSCIGHATRTSLTSGAWADSGGPVFCSNVTSSVNWNAIDPNVILDESGNPWLVFGSGWDGIHIVRLTSTGALDTTSAFTRIATRTAGVIESGAMLRRCGYYYLFTSWDRCCQGASSTYNIRVGRSTSMTGGFVDKNGTALTSGGGTLVMSNGNGWVGPGGQFVFVAGTRAYLVYHAYASNDGHFQLHISDLYFDSSGWPVTTASP
jgi:arabinan endo-1,5-alpha-L-arabinosidase